MWHAFRAATRARSAVRAFSTFTDGMNEAQLRVVNARGRPLLVAGGAGTGKSVSLAARLSGLVQRGEAASGDVLGVAMSEATQRRLQHHVDVCTPLRFGNVHVGTVHAWALEMVQAHAMQLQLPGVRVLQPWREPDLLTRNLMHMPLKLLRPVGERTRYVRGMLAAFGRLQRAGVGSDELRAEASAGSGREAAVWAEVADAWDAFTDIKLQRGLLTFDDQITQALRLLRENEAAARDVRAQYSHIVCDDAQDLTPAQLELLARASSSAESIAFACDEDARVYPCAVPSAVTALRAQYGDDLAVETLHSGYRCAQGVHDAARRLVCMNRGRVEVESALPMHVDHVDAPPLFATVSGHGRDGGAVLDGADVLGSEVEGVVEVWGDAAEYEAGADEAVRAVESEGDAGGMASGGTGHDGGGDAVRVAHVAFADQWGEEDGVARMVAERWEHEGVQPGDVVVLTRTNDDAERMARALDRHGVPTAGVSGQGVLQVPEVARLVTFLRVAADPSNTAQLYSWLTSPPMGLQPREITFLMRVRNRHKLTLRGAIARVARGDKNESYPRELRDVCTRVARDVDMWEGLAVRTPAKELLFRYLKHYQLLDRYYSPPNARAEREGHSVARFVRMLDQIGRESGTGVAAASGEAEGLPAALLLPRLESAAAVAAHEPATPDHPDTPNQVRVMPLLKAAHIDCEHVYLVRASDTALPGRRWTPMLPLPDKLVLPSSRDAHVESMRRLVYVAMTRASSSITFTHAASYGGKRRHRPSRFIAEAMITPAEQPAPAATDVPPPPPPPPPPPVEEEPRVAASPEEFTVPLSFTRIKAYTTCPAMYQFQYVMKLPQALPAKVAVGRALHHAVDVHGRSLLESGSSGGGGDGSAEAPTTHVARGYAPHVEEGSVSVGEAAPLDVTVAAGAGEEAVLQEALRRTWKWGGNGFLSAEDERDSYAYCKEVLAGYFQRHKESGRVVCAVEMPFRIVSNDGLYRLVGRIDRLERTPDGELVVVEFKTRLPRTIKALTTKMGRRRKGAQPDLQLLLYTFAFHRVYGHLPARCMRVALDDGREDSFVPEEGDLVTAQRVVEEVAEGVRANRFHATPTFKACRKCAYANVCKDKYSRRK